MSEIDYQMALLLQHKFEQEVKQPERSIAQDFKLARKLQEQFEREVESPNPNLVYDSKKSLNTSKCLIDPSWELVDPTPDIHILFVAFNNKFFWNKLLPVCVSWSKRMTTCAGICSYQGRGGLCSITLSEPLLKLRPRKDLVETLLHEMIHAYLFITQNNRDRDGHGPEFHKHMYRINAEAGTKITVYHNFHDEVRLYQQHWWRCDGPCQKWKPYFGMVRRAMNRPPGPTDRWFGQHSRSCGGTFIKVKEPEKTEKISKATGKPSKSNKENKPKEDIRKFLPNLQNKTSAGNIKTINNVQSVKNDNGGLKVATVISSKDNNIVGFSNSNKVSSTSGSSSLGKTMGNKSSTIVVTKKPTTQVSGAYSQQSNGNSSTGQPKNGPQTVSDDNPNLNYSTVRNHWLSKYPSVSDKKRPCETAIHVPKKVPKLSLENSRVASSPKNKIEVMECPICVSKIPLPDFNEHLDQCLQSPDKKSKQCLMCGKEFSQKDYNNHVPGCFENFEDDIFDDDNVGFKNSTEVQKQCQACNKWVSSSAYDLHAAECLMKMYDNMEAKYINNEKNVMCLACGKNILRSDLDSHLEECASLSTMFDNETKLEEDGIEIIKDNKENNKSDVKYNCPCCMKLVLESEMNNHLNDCLSI